VDGDETYTVVAGQTLTISAPGLLANATDADGDDVLVTGFFNPAEGTLTSVVTDGSFIYVAPTNFVGADTFTYIVKDEYGAENSSTVTINVLSAAEKVLLGDAPVRLSTSNPTAWIDAWTKPGISITHKASFVDSGEAWSAVALNGLNAQLLSGGDLFGGDLGVSGQNLGSSAIKQEIDGAQALKFSFDKTAVKVEIDLNRFYVDDDGMAFNFNEAGRVQAFDAQGNLVAEETFFATRTDGTSTVALEHAEGFQSIVVTAGAYNGANFVFGAYADDTGTFASAPYSAAGTQYGSEFLLDSVEFTFLAGVGNPIQP
jgi:hypothetical protein